jgi:hypothetical protein
MTRYALVCGAGGFIGGHLVKWLKREGCWVRGVDLKFHEFSETDASRPSMPIVVWLALLMSGLSLAFINDRMMPRQLEARRLRRRGLEKPFSWRVSSVTVSGWPIMARMCWPVFLKFKLC